MSYCYVVLAAADDMICGPNVALIIVFVNLIMCLLSLMDSRLCHMICGLICIGILTYVDDILICLCNDVCYFVLLL
jgi:hypothetical protein